MTTHTRPADYWTYNNFVDIFAWPLYVARLRECSVRHSMEIKPVDADANARMSFLRETSAVRIMERGQEGHNRRSVWNINISIILISTVLCTCERAMGRVSSG